MLERPDGVAQGLPALGLVVESGDAAGVLHQSLGQSAVLPLAGGLLVRLDELELEGRAAAVENEDFHRSLYDFPRLCARFAFGAGA